MALVKKSLIIPNFKSDDYNNSLHNTVIVVFISNLPITVKLGFNKLSWGIMS